MRFSALVSFLLLLTLSASAKNYYFSSMGSDYYTTNSFTTPWKSLNKVNKIHLLPGDRVLFRSGDYFYGKIILNSSGAYNNIIFIGTYGGELPAVINGTSDIKHWTLLGNGIYYSDPLTCESDVKNVIFDYKQAEQGRYPDDYPGTGGFLPYQSHIINPGNTCTINSIYAPLYGIDSSWVGATLKIKTYVATLESGKIYGITNTGSITFDNSNMFYNVGYDNCGYYITNSLKTLDLMKEWYYNPTNKRLYMHFGTDNPNSHVVTVSTIDTLFQPKGSHYLINNLVFNGANKYAVCNNYAHQSDISFYNTKFLNSGVTAIAFSGRSNLLFLNCTVDGANTSGIVAVYNCDSVRIINSTVKNIGMLSANLSTDSVFNRRSGYGIFSSAAPAKGLYMENCEVSNIAYIGVYFTGGRDTIYRNYFANTCMFLDDGGAIYYSGSKVPGKNNLIRRNIVLNCQGYWYGFPAYATIPNSIFLDDYSGNVLIDSNYVKGSGQSCSYLHNGFNCTFQDNIFTEAKAYLFTIQDDHVGPKVHNINFYRNCLLLTSPTPYVYRVCASGDSDNNQVTQFGAMDNNYILAPSLSGNYFHADTFNFPGISDRTFLQWKQEMPYDKHSTFINSMERGAKTFYSTTKDTTILIPKGQTWQKVDGTILRDSIRLKDHTGIILLTAGWLPIT